MTSRAGWVSGSVLVLTLAAFTSTDRGGTWKPSTGLPASDAVNSMVSDPRRPKHLFAGTDGRGVFRSVDAGARWDPVGRR